MFSLNHYVLDVFVFRSKACDQEFCVSGALTREPFPQCLQLLLNGQMSITEPPGIASQLEIVRKYMSMSDFV